MGYAKGTEVSVERSREELERMLRRRGASHFMYGWNQAGPSSQAILAFQIGDRRIQFTLPLPDPADDAFVSTPSGKWTRSQEQQQAEYEKEVKRRWRALLLVIKAKFEAVDTGITSIEDEFLAHFVTASGETIGERLRPTLDKVLETGKLPPLLPGGPA